jgi:hypothetical protein
MIPGRSRFSHFYDRRIIATAGTHSEHKSCAVKLHAYTLDSSINLASALQQNVLFPQLSGIVLSSRSQHDKGSAPATDASFINPESAVIESNAET